ncbi:hypothetical protein KAW96_09785 [candidate division WOR-3 bacterium]|nr:hypothetical protein [candidate division WOR-3 bacterium]
MKKFALLFVFLLLVSFIFVDCRRGGDSPIPGVGKKIGKKLEFDDTDDILLTEKEVKAFIKAYPVFKATMEKEGEKFKGADKNILRAMRSGRQVVKYVKRINKVLKPYGFDMESFMKTFIKVQTSHAYMLMGGMDKLMEENIKRMKETLKDPNMPDEVKEEIRESIKEMEEQMESEEAKANKKNAEILEKYKDDLEELFK